MDLGSFRNKVDYAVFLVTLEKIAWNLAHSLSTNRVSIVAFLIMAYLSYVQYSTSTSSGYTLYSESSTT